MVGSGRRFELDDLRWDHREVGEWLVLVAPEDGAEFGEQIVAVGSATTEVVEVVGGTQYLERDRLAQRL